MNEVVKYDNQMNNIAFKGMTAMDIDLFMLICAKTKESKEEVFKFDFTELKKAIGISKKTDRFFLQEIQRVAKKLKHIGGSFNDGVSFDEFTLFPTFHGTIEDESNGIYGHLKKGTMIVRVNPDYSFLLNELTKNFTRFELSEFVKLESKYSKNLYRLLKQYRKTGTYRVETAKFRELMDCPKSYSNKIFMYECVSVAVKELSRGYFEDLKVTPIRDIGRGRPIIAYEFTFKKSSDIPGQYRIDDYQETPPQKKEKKGKKNRFNNFNQRDYDFSEYERMLLQGSGTTGEQRENGKTD